MYFHLRPAPIKFTHTYMTSTNIVHTGEVADEGNESKMRLELMKRIADTRENGEFFKSPTGSLYSHVSVNQCKMK